jgi:hypothetical protein
MSHNVSEKKVERWLLDNIESDFEVKVTQRPKQKKENPKKYRDRLKRLNDIYLMGNISESEYKEKSAELQRKIAELSKEPKEPVNVFTKDWKDVYRMLDDEHKRSFWHKLLKEVKVNEDGLPIEILY